MVGTTGEGAMALARLTTRLVTTPQIAYDGRQLKAHFLRSRFGVLGDAAVIFRGPCEVLEGELVDLADREAGLFIRSQEMLHLIVERFDPDLVRGVLLQRLIAACVEALLRRHLASSGLELRREGDDVFVGEGKLSVSIATVSPVSTLIHFGINIVAEGAPVKVAALAALGVDPESFAAELLAAVAEELEQVSAAVSKVRAVGEYEDGSK